MKCIGETARKRKEESRKTEDESEEKELDDESEEKELDDESEEKELDNVEEKEVDNVEEKELDNVEEKELDNVKVKKLDDVEESEEEKEKPRRDFKYYFNRFRYYHYVIAEKIDTFIAVIAMWVIKMTFAVMGFNINGLPSIDEIEEKNFNTRGNTN